MSSVSGGPGAGREAEEEEEVGGREGAEDGAEEHEQPAETLALEAEERRMLEEALAREASLVSISCVASLARISTCTLRWFACSGHVDRTRLDSLLVTMGIAFSIATLAPPCVTCF